MDVPQYGERGVAPQVITNVDKWWIPGVIALSRFSNTGKIFVQRVAQQCKNTLQVESVLIYTRNKSLFFEK